MMEKHRNAFHIISPLWRESNVTGGSPQKETIARSLNLFSHIGLKKMLKNSRVSGDLGIHGEYVVSLYCQLSTKDLFSRKQTITKYYNHQYYAGHLRCYQAKTPRTTPFINVSS